MAKAKFQRTKPHCNIGTIDQFDEQERMKMGERVMRDQRFKRDHGGDNSQIITGRALVALEHKNPESGKESILKLTAAVDEWIPQPERQLDKPSLMPIEDVF